MKEIQWHHFIFTTVGENLQVKSQMVMHLILVSRHCFYFKVCHTKICHNSLSLLYFIKAGENLLFPQSFSNPRRSCQTPVESRFVSNPISKSEKTILHTVCIEVLKDLPMCIKPGLLCAIYSPIYVLEIL